jgi:hypothetical protein
MRGPLRSPHPLAALTLRWTTDTISILMDLSALYVVAIALTAANPGRGDNPIFKELVEKGVPMSDGLAVKLPRPILPNGLDAAGQQKAIANAPRARSSVKELLTKSYYAPVEVKIRTVKEPEPKIPGVRIIDAWFVVHGNWDILRSKDFLESVAGKDEGKGKSRVVSKSGVLTPNELAERKLTVADRDGLQSQFVYSTFSLFERVEISATRFAALLNGKESLLAAGQIDRRFNHDREYPNEWRPLVRDAQAEIRRGKPHPFLHAGGYAKITRLVEPANAAFVEFHLVYEEDYGWFDGINLVKQKVPVMVQEKVRTFRRKLAIASEKK